MKNISDLIKTWSLPDRSQERAQLTVRINFDLYAKLQALKEVYPTRSVNDLVADILGAGVNEIIEALPTYTTTLPEIEAYELADYYQQPIENFLGPKESGPSVSFRTAYAKILEQKTASESESESKIDEAA